LCIKNMSPYLSDFTQSCHLTVHHAKQ
jgi:hypothetical protein